MVPSNGVILSPLGSRIVVPLEFARCSRPERRQDSAARRGSVCPILSEIICTVSSSSLLFGDTAGNSVADHIPGCSPAKPPAEAGPRSLKRASVADGPSAGVRAPFTSQAKPRAPIKKVTAVRAVPTKPPAPPQKDLTVPLSPAFATTARLAGRSARAVAQEPGAPERGSSAETFRFQAQRPEGSHVPEGSRAPRKAKPAAPFGEHPRSVRPCALWCLQRRAWRSGKQSATY